MAFCKNCGHRLTEGAFFCINCGMKVHDIISVPVLAAEEHGAAAEADTEITAEAEATAHTEIAEKAEATAEPEITVEVEATAEPGGVPQPEAAAEAETAVSAEEIPVAEAEVPARIDLSPEPERTERLPAAEPVVLSSSGAEITAGGFFGILLLQCIPVINLIFLIVWACGGCKKETKKNYARAVLLMSLIQLVVLLIVCVMALLVLGADGIVQIFEILGRIF